MILTEQEIKDAVGFTTDQMTAYRRIESAVLEKLKAQEPVGVFANVNGLTPEAGARWEQMVDEAYDGKEYIHLYRHPLPPDDVVRDPRVAELEAVLRECREALVKNIVGTGGRTPAAHEAIAKIDEVLNVPDISRTA